TAEEQQAADQASLALTATDDGTTAAAAAQPDAAGTVEEQTISEADVRTTSQDFSTQAVVTEGVAVQEERSGLSGAQKAALGALGILAVGTVLANRNRVVSNSGDRVVVQRDDGSLSVLKDDDALLRQAGSNVRTESFDDGSTRTIVTREDGSQVITVRDASLRVLRRVLVQTDGTEYTLIDDTVPVNAVEVSSLPEFNPAAVSTRTGDDALRQALAREQGLDRRFSLSQVRNIAQVRALAPAFEVNNVTFASGSAAITPEQAGNLTDLARQVLDAIRANPREVFLVEGHTDAVGDAAYNLALSDRRAETLALALNEYFNVPVENMVVQGYGEQFLKVQTLTDEAANRRATVRQITGLLQTAAAN
ncbi:MAG: OmpA family protein, partial [Jannaschia sp.]